MNPSFNLLFQKYNRHTPGCAIGVVKNGNLINQYYIGLSNLETKTPISKNTAFRLASLTKPFTVMAIMILKKKGAISYDDTIRRFFCGFPSYGDTITIRQLLSHTSGLPGHEKPLYDCIKQSDRPDLYDALCILSQTQKPYFDPGSRYQYSDSAYVMLALIIERVSGMRYSEFIKHTIFQPLQLKNTYVCVSDTTQIPHRALGYRRIGKKYEVFDSDPLNYILGDEGIYSTIPDLAIWTTAWETDVLTNKSNISLATKPYRCLNGTLGRCGFAWFIDPYKNIRFQDGIWVGFTNIILTDTAKQTTAIVLSNTRDFANERQRVAIASRVLEKLDS